jgi:4-carboxymuconolactone decarboxylase
MSLSPGERRLCALFGAAVLGNWPRLKQWRASMPESEVGRGVREAILQVHLFAGMPRGVEAWNVLQEAGGVGVVDPEEHESPTEGLGAVLFQRIYADDAGTVKAHLERQHPVHAQWILQHAYGTVLARDGLTPRMREILACVALALTGQERQLISHVRGAVRCGADRVELLEALECVHGLDEGGHVPSAEETVTRLFP